MKEMDEMMKEIRFMIESVFISDSADQLCMELKKNPCIDLLEIRGNAYY